MHDINQENRLSQEENRLEEKIAALREASVVWNFRTADTSFSSPSSDMSRICPPTSDLPVRYRLPVSSCESASCLLKFQESPVLRFSIRHSREFRAVAKKKELR